MLVPYKEILLLHREKKIFLLSAKCASSSVRRMAFKKLKYSMRQGLTYLQLNELDEYKDYEKYMIVRNPYSRIVSLYNHKILKISHKTLHKTFSKFGMHKRMSFFEFVTVISKVPDKIADPHFTSQTVFYDYVKPDHILKLENIDREWYKTGLTLLKIENKSNNTRSWKEYYNKETRKLVQQRYKRDFEILGYKK